MVCPTAHSPSTGSLARPPRDVPAAILRARDCSSRPWPRPGHREHTAVQVVMLCAHIGTQHQQMHKSTPYSSAQLIPGPIPRARVRSDPWKHGSPIARTRQTPHRPQQPHIAPHCTMSGTTLYTLPHAAAHLHERDTLREHDDSAPYARAQAAHANAARAAASQRRPLGTSLASDSLLLARCPANLPRG